MFKVPSIVLTAALFGLNTASTTAIGCYPAYSSATTYTNDSSASSTETVDTISTTSCTVGNAGCPASGFITTTTTTIKTFNYKCFEPLYCNKVGHGPTEQGGIVAWTKDGECTGSQAPPAAIIPASYSSTTTGCPAPYSGGDDYAPADLVSVVNTAYTAVYQCASTPSNLFCGQSGYEPGSSQYGSTVWTEIGSCTGTLSPTGSPSFDAMNGVGGCPGDYSAGESYDEGDRISKSGLVYQCKSYPSSDHCGQDGYEPGEDFPSAADPYWKMAWDVVGWCSGTIAPTSSPSFVSLEDMGGCPDTWSARTAGEAYEEGDRVSDGALVYTCKAWPYSAHCGQAGYEPNTNPATPNAWKDAWTVMGFCSGSIGPTASPSIDAANSVGACPDEWEAGSNVKYEEGDMVSATVSDVPLRKVAFECKAWPYSGHCGQYSPLHETGGSLGWTLAGSCDGSIGPTQSPSFDKLSEVIGGCPSEYSSSATDYEAGDLVAITVSSSPGRKVVYQCKDDIHASNYCNNREEAYTPGEWAGYLGWTLKGYCDGSMPPTTSPVQYMGTSCTYIKCTDDKSCARDVASNGVSGSTACSCTTLPTGSTATQCTTGTQTECVVTPVDLWSATSVSSYNFGDVVRIGAQRYKCKQSAEGGWCSNAVYKAGTQLGADAWTLDGTCPP